MQRTDPVRKPVAAVEPRFATSIWLVGGVFLQSTFAEVDGINYITRVTMPVLMVNGRYDHIFPYRSSQLPTFSLLSTPDEHKKLFVSEAGHAIDRTDLIRETLDWLDQYFGNPR